MNFYNILATIVASAIGTTIAGFIGFRFALAKLRRDTAFSRTLEWHERTAKAFIEAAHAVDVAISDEEVQRDTGGWQALFNRLAALGVFRQEAELYANNETCAVIIAALADIGVLGNVLVAGVGQGGVSERDLNKLWRIVAKMLRSAGSRLGDDVREHLGLSPLLKERGLYDDDFRREYAALLARRQERDPIPPP